jgi:hypothetical protein
VCSSELQFFGSYFGSFRVPMVLLSNFQALKEQSKLQAAADGDMKVIT